MEPVTGTQAAFFYLEQKKTAMNVGGLFIFRTNAKDNTIVWRDQPNLVSIDTPSAKKPTLAVLKRHIRNRLHLSETFRKRLVESPVKILKPVWIKDPHFDLNHHVRALDGSMIASKSSLLQLVGKQAEQKLDRGSPLWRLYLIRDLENIPEYDANAYAIILIAHQAAVDGRPITHLMQTLMDDQANAPLVKPSLDWQPDALPSHNELLEEAQKELTALPKQLTDLATRASQLLTRSYFTRNLEVSESVPPKLFSAPQTIFNKPIDGSRSFSGIIIDNDRFQKLLNQLDHVSLNDLILCICTGAIRHYFLRAKRLPKKDMIALLPVQLETGSPQSQRFSGMLLALPTSDSDPINRLNNLHKRINKAKSFSKLIAPEEITDQIPYATGTILTKVYNTLRLSRLHRPAINLMIFESMIKGGPFYLRGAKMTEQFCSTPIYDGIGLTLTVSRMPNDISIGITSSPNIIPRMNLLAKDFYYAIDELEASLQLVPCLAPSNDATKQKNRYQFSRSHQNAYFQFDNLPYDIDDFPNRPSPAVKRRRGKKPPNPRA